MSSAILRAFLCALRKPAMRPESEIEAALEGCIQTARKALPEIDVPEDAFAALLAAYVEGPRERDLAELPVVDLWLALACARGDAAALRTLEARTFPRARGALSRMGLDADGIAEVLQILRERLFLAEPGEQPRILSAAAHGDLEGILRVAAVRTALNLRRSDHRREDSDAPLCAALAPDDDPELAVLKAQQRVALKAAIEDALAGLEPRQRNVLRMHLVHGLSIDEIGRSYQVHRATAARWLEGIRGKLDRETRRLLNERLGLTEPEFDSLFRLVESRIDVSFHRLLTSSHG